MSIEPFNKLVKLVGRAFYGDITKGDNQPKTGQSDNKGITVVVLDALSRRQWVREEDLAKDLKLHSKQLRRTLQFFEEEKLVTRDHRREIAKGTKMHNPAVAATIDGLPEKEGEEKVKMHTHSYCCLDYAQVVAGSAAWLGRGLSCVCAQRRESDARPSFDLTPVQEECLLRHQSRIDVPCESSLLEHQEALRDLWNAAFPEEELRGLISEQWKEMGCQGKDSSTYFRVVVLYHCRICCSLLGISRSATRLHILCKAPSTNSDRQVEIMYITEHTSKKESGRKCPYTL